MLLSRSVLAPSLSAYIARRRWCEELAGLVHRWKVWVEPLAVFGCDARGETLGLELDRAHHALLELRALGHQRIDHRRSAGGHAGLQRCAGHEAPEQRLWVGVLRDLAARSGERDVVEVDLAVA